MQGARKIYDAEFSEVRPALSQITPETPAGPMISAKTASILGILIFGGLLFLGGLYIGRRVHADRSDS